MLTGGQRIEGEGLLTLGQSPAGLAASLPPRLSSAPSTFSIRLRLSVAMYCTMLLAILNQWWLVARSTKPEPFLQYPANIHANDQK